MPQSKAIPSQLRLKLIASIVDFMSRSGATEAEIRKSFERGLRSVQPRSESLRSGERSLSPVGDLAISAELLRLWHRDGRYIDRDARPRPLYLAKGRDSLKQAIQRIDSKADPGAIIKGMKAVGLIRRNSQGKYSPTSEVAIIGELHPIAVEHVAKTVIHLVSTVRRNTDPKGGYIPLIERHAYVPDLNPSDRQAFAEFTRSQGMAYLESVDDWLQQRRSRRASPKGRSRKAGVAASVHLVAYLGDEPGQVSPPLPAPAARRATAVSREARV
jgi:hypothetical protein